MAQISELPVVLVDMDGVLANFNDEILSRIAERHPDIPLLEHHPSFYISDDYPEHSELFKKVSCEPGFFEALPLIDDALEGWQRIIDLGYVPQICSSPLSGNPTCEEDKLAWLKKHFVPTFGESVVTQALITRNKHLCKGIALIDDRPEVYGVSEASWSHIIFDRQYNERVLGPRLMGWLDDKLPELLDTALRASKNT